MSPTLPEDTVPTRPTHQGAVRPEDGPQDVPQEPGSVVSDLTNDEENA